MAGGMGLGLGLTRALGARSVITDTRLTHRWRFTESTGTVFQDEVGSIDLTAFSGCALDFDGTDDQVITTDVGGTSAIEATIKGKTYALIGCQFRYDTAADTAGDQLVGGSDLGGPVALTIDSPEAKIGLKLVLHDGTSAADYATTCDLVMADETWYQVVAKIDLRAATRAVTIMTRSMNSTTYVWSAWTETDVIAALALAAEKSYTFHADGADHLLCMAYDSEGTPAYTDGAMASAFVAWRIPSLLAEDDISSLFDDPTSVNVQALLGNKSVFLVFDAGVGTAVHDLGSMGYHGTSSGTPTWETNIAGIAQAGMRRGSYTMGASGFTGGTLAGGRTTSYAAAPTTAAEASRSIFTRGAPLPSCTIEIIARAGIDSALADANYATLWECSGLDGTNAAGVALMYKPKTGGFLFIYKARSGSTGITQTLTTAAPYDGSVWKFIIKWTNSTAARIYVNATRLESTALTAFVSPGAVTITDNFQTTETTPATVSVGSPMIDTRWNTPMSTTMQGLARDASVMEVRVYNAELSDAELLRNHLADRRYHGYDFLYVDMAAPYSGNGSYDQPFSTFKPGYKRLTLGTTLNLSGSTTELIDDSVAASASAPSAATSWTLTGTGEIKPTAGTLANACILLAASATKDYNNITISGITLDANSSEGVTNAIRCITLTSAAGGYGNLVTMSDLTLKNTWETGAGFNGDAIFSSMPFTRVRDCSFDTTESQGVYLNPGTTGHMPGCEVSGCTFANIGRGCIQTSNESDTTKFVTAPLIVNNRCADGVASSGVTLGGSNGGLVFNNIMHVAVNGLAFRVGYDAAPSKNCVLINNTADGGGTGGYGFQEYGIADNPNTYINNVCNGATYEWNTDAVSTAVIRYNVGERATASNGWPTGDGNLPASTVTFVDDDNVDPTLRDYTLTGDGIGVGTPMHGTYTRLATDINGTARPGTAGTDMGAVQS